MKVLKKIKAARAAGKIMKAGKSAKLKRPRNTTAPTVDMRKGALGDIEEAVKRLVQSKCEFLAGEYIIGEAMGREWVLRKADYPLLKSFIERDQVGALPGDDTVQPVQLIGNRCVIVMSKMFGEWRWRDAVLTSMFGPSFRECSDTRVRGFVQGAEDAYRMIEKDLEESDVAGSVAPALEGCRKAKTRASA